METDPGKFEVAEAGEQLPRDPDILCMQQDCPCCTQCHMQHEDGAAQA